MFEDLFGEEKPGGSHKLNLRFFKWFLEASVEKSITKAAEKHSASPAAYCRGIGQLQEQLELELFRRSKQGIKLTPVGERLAKTVREFMIQLREIRAEEALHGSKIKFIGGSAAMQWMVMPKAESLVELFEGRSFEFSRGGSDDVVHRVSQEEQDFGIIWRDLVHQGASYADIGEMTCQGAVGGGLSAPKTLEEEKHLLENSPLILVSKRGRFRKSLEESLEASRIRSPRTIVCRDFDEVLIACRHFSGFGFFISGEMAVPNIPDGVRTFPSFLMKEYQRTVSLIWNQNRLKARRIDEEIVMSLLELLKGHCEYPKAHWPTGSRRRM